MRRVALAVLMLTILTACSSGDDGAGDGGGTTTGPVTSEDSAAAELTLTSPAFEEGGEIPVENAACVDGGEAPNEAPSLDWEGVDDDAQQLAVTMVDPDAADFVHWVMVGIDPSADGLASGEVPAGAVEAQNVTGETGYFGPCPPDPHTYVFTLHVLDADPGIDSATAGADAVAAVEAVSAHSDELTGVYDPVGG